MSAIINPMDVTSANNFFFHIWRQEIFLLQIGSPGSERAVGEFR